MITATPISTDYSPGSLKVEAATNKGSGESLAEQMKNIKKAKLRRMAMQDPSLHKKLVATEASPVYNTSGNVIAAVSTTLGQV